MGKREPQIILKTDERKVTLELGLQGKFSAKSTAWDENRVFLEGDKLQVAGQERSLGADASACRAASGAEPAQHYFPAEM
jgi:hypothetical protein